MYLQIIIIKFIFTPKTVSFFFIRVVWESPKNSTSLSLWQSCSMLDWNATSRSENMTLKLQSKAFQFLCALCCWTWNIIGWRESAVRAAIVQSQKNGSQAVNEWSPPPLLVQVSSLPVVVISSTNQVLSAWASVMWCNTLSTSEPRVKPSHLNTTNKQRQDLCSYTIRLVHTSHVQIGPFPFFLLCCVAHICKFNHLVLRDILGQWVRTNY